MAITGGDTENGLELASTRSAESKIYNPIYKEMILLLICMIMYSFGLNETYKIRTNQNGDVLVSNINDKQFLQLYIQIRFKLALNIKPVL